MLQFIKFSVHFYRSRPDCLCIVDNQTGKPIFVSSERKIYCAMGLKLDYDLTKFIPKKNVITPFSYHENEWIAPRSELPIGSLTESCSKWARMTHNEKWATEFFAFHDTHISESLHQKMASENFNMSSGSFDKLKEKITSLEKISEDALNKLFFECLDVQNEDEKEMGVKTLPSLIFKR